MSTPVTSVQDPSQHLHRTTAQDAGAATRLVLPASSELVLQRAMLVALTLLSLLWTVGVIVDALTVDYDVSLFSLGFSIGYGVASSLAMGTAALLFILVVRDRRAASESTGATLEEFETVHQRSSVRLRVARTLIHVAVWLAPLMLVGQAGVTVTSYYPVEDLVSLSWVVIGVTISGSLALTAISTELRTWLYLLVVLAIYVPAAALVPESDTVAILFTVARCLVSTSFIIAAVDYLRSLARSVDTALLNSATDLARAGTEAAEVAEAARIDGLVHDHILAALLLASRADHREDAPFVRRSAAAALSALSEITSPRHQIEVTAEGEPQETVPVAAFAAQLIGQARAAAPSISCTGRGGGTGDVPVQVAETLAAAAMEAVRNSLRHADPTHGGVRRTLRIETVGAGLRVTVQDDGVGFDPTTAGKGRYGLKGSILGRLNALEGGEGSVVSAPGEGTVVQLEWTPPQRAGHGTGHLRNSEENAASNSNSQVVHELTKFSESLAEDVPFGPLVRGSLGVIIGVSVMALMSFSYFDPWWVNAIAIGVFLAWTPYLLILWGTHRLGDPTPAAALTMSLTTGFGFLITLSFWNGPQHQGLTIWSMSVAIFIPIMLGLSNFPRLAWVSSVLCGLALVIWDVFISDDSLSNVYLAGLFLFLPLAVNWIQRTSLNSIATAAEVSESHSDVITGRSQQISAANERRRRGLRVDALARPLLERLAAGEHTELPVRIEAMQLEAHLRDDLRARCFRDTDVTRAANEARRAGVRVELLDDGGLASVDEALREEVIELAARVLDTAENGSVTIRVAPPGRDIVATMVTRPDLGQPARLEIHANLIAAGAGAGRGQEESR